MKLTKFKLRPVMTKAKDSIMESNQDNQNNTIPSKESEDKLKGQFSLIKKMMADSKLLSLKSSEMEARDRHLIVQSSNKVEDVHNKDQLQAWIGEVCRDVVSSTFHFYLKGQMTFEQAKIYCCQQLLQNIAQFAQKNITTPQFFDFVDKIMKNKILPYLDLKYPPSFSNEVNKALNKMIKEINNMEVITNDFLYSSNIQFEYRQKGIYNDLIMKVINQIIKIPDSHSIFTNDEQSITNFEDFSEFISNLFQKVYDQQWMIKKKKVNTSNIKSIDNNQQEKQNRSQKEQLQREKYKEKVQQYTHYLIGRKISENIQQFDESQIKSGFISIKNPTILRIMTKWCQQLWEKFQNQNYFIDRTEGLSMLKGKQVNIIYIWLKQQLKNKMKAQKQKILQYMKNIEANNYQQQHLIMKSQLASNQAPFMNKYQRVCGKFSVSIINNLQNYIIIYLNRLIHGLMTVSTNVYSQMSSMPSWPYPPNLLSFNIGDLLRCKYISKQRQILKIFEQLQTISQNSPEKLRIIRIKNRLKLGTNDILINVRFNNCLIAEIQLSVKSKAAESQFSLCSYNFSHFIYELQRSYFGPLSQMCSIWTNLDPRTKIFKKLIREEKAINRSNQLKESYCLLNQKAHIIQVAENIPFMCSECGKAYSNNNFAIPHQKCRKCNFWKCALCFIKQRQSSDLIQFVIKQQEIRQNCNPSRCNILPQYSVCVLIEDKTNETNVFKLIQAFEKRYLFKLVNNQYYELFKQLSTENMIKQFVLKYLIYELKPSFINTLPELNKNIAIKEKIIPAYVNKCFKFQKQTISLNGLKQHIKYQQFSNILSGTKQQQKCLKFLQISSNGISNIDFLSAQFKNLEFLNVNINSIQEIKHLSNFKKLNTLFAMSNSINQIPIEICFLGLKYLSLASNKIQEIPQQFNNLKKLEILRINNNSIQKIPSNLSNLQRLRQVYVSNNRIKDIKSFSHCKKIQYLEIQNNLIQKLPRQLQSLLNLSYFNVSSNKISHIQAQFSCLKKLKQFQVMNNPIQLFSPQLSNAPQLSKLNLSKSKIQLFQLKGIVLPALKQLLLSPGLITTLEDIQGIKNLDSLNLEANKLTTLPSDFHLITKLTILKLNLNQLTELPQTFGELLNLKQLHIKNNKLTKFPISFSKLKKLKILSFDLNLFCQLQKQIFTLHALQILSFSSNIIQQISPLIGNLLNLKNLDISMNKKITKLPNQINNLKKIKSLLFNGIVLQSIPMISFFSGTNLRNKNIKQIPENLTKNQQVENLYLNQNQITIIPKSITNLINLKLLFLNANKLTQFSVYIFELVHLTEIQLANNKIKILPDKFDKLIDLKILNVGFNLIQVIPKTMQALLKKNLNFNFEGNPLISVPEWFINFHHKFAGKEIILNNFKINILPSLKLKTLCNSIYLQNNNFQQFPQSLMDLPKLQIIDLSNNNIRLISDQIYKLQNLTKLTLNNNKIQTLPENFGLLKNLKVLYILINPLQQLPSNFQNIMFNILSISADRFDNLSKTNSLQFIQTKILDLSKQNLSKLPDCIGEIKYVEDINLEANCIQRLPQSLTNLKTLKQLKINNQPLAALPQNIGNLVNLKRIQCASCKISEIPSTIGKLKILQDLSIYDCVVKEIPETIGELQNIKVLNIRSNQLQKLPDSIGKLINLQIISIRENKLTQFPVSLCKCIKLKEIYCQSNLITKIPRELQSLTQLLPKKLLLKGNPLQSIDCMQFVLKKGDQGTIQLAKQIKSKNSILQ